MTEKLIIALIFKYSLIFGVDPIVALSVAEVESRLEHHLVGEKGEIGIYQLMPSSFPDVKVKDLFDPETNIRLGIKYLAWNKKYCNHTQDHTYLVCWNYGIGNAKKVKHPKLFPYYKKVQKVRKQYETSLVASRYFSHH